MESLSPETFKNHLDATLCYVLWSDPARAGRLDKTPRSGPGPIPRACDSVHVDETPTSRCAACLQLISASMSVNEACWLLPVSLTTAPLSCLKAHTDLTLKNLLTEDNTDTAQTHRHTDIYMKVPTRTHSLHRPARPPWRICRYGAPPGSTFLRGFARPCPRRSARAPRGGRGRSRSEGRAGPGEEERDRERDRPFPGAGARPQRSRAGGGRVRPMDRLCPRRSPWKEPLGRGRWRGAAERG